MQLFSTVVETPLGPLAVTADDGAIVLCSWGHTPGGDVTPLLRDAAEQLRAYFDRRLDVFDLPLRPAGTAFQTAVWHGLSRIPYGKTITYGELAGRVGGGPRAVGGACGRNPIAVILPCHRVVGAGDRLTGYSGGNGVATKAALLELERRTCSTER